MSWGPAAGTVQSFPHNVTLLPDNAWKHAHAQGAVVDLALLASCRFLLGSQESSYTTTAELMGAGLAFRLRFGSRYPDHKFCKEQA